MKIKTNVPYTTIKIVSAFALVFAVLVSTNFIYAQWSPPPSNPPANNVPTPLNEGNQTQNKQGKLGAIQFCDQAGTNCFTSPDVPQLKTDVTQLKTNVTTLQQQGGPNNLTLRKVMVDSPPAAFPSISTITGPSFCAITYQNTKKRNGYYYNYGSACNVWRPNPTGAPTTWTVQAAAFKNVTTRCRATCF